MRLLIAGLALALTTAAAQAQLGTQPGTAGGSTIGAQAQSQADRAKKLDEVKVKANDKAYNAALQNLPNKQYDPWHGVR